MINFQKFLNSLKIALSGLKTALKTEENFRIQALIGFIVIILMFVLGVSVLERSILILVVFVVLSLELINSQIEKFLDLIQPVLHPKVKIIKDLSAAAVLISVFGAIIIGILIFFPHFFK
ncbi:MAG: diacylglycerol kinase family protein [Candidatus Pacebacteria bacterium]|nr:diacylglycerol kinase family protein [Candidatus Paceibacterota bacterium]